MLFNYDIIIILKYFLKLGNNFKLAIKRNNGDWGLGIGDGGLGIGDWAQSPIPNPQSPIPNPHINKINKQNINNKNKYTNI